MLRGVELKGGALVNRRNAGFAVLRVPARLDAFRLEFHFRRLLLLRPLRHVASDRLPTIVPHLALPQRTFLRKFIWDIQRTTESTTQGTADFEEHRGHREDRGAQRRAACYRTQDCQCVFGNHKGHEESQRTQRGNADCSVASLGRPSVTQIDADFGRAGARRLSRIERKLGLKGCGALPHTPAGRSSPCTPGTSATCQLARRNDKHDPAGGSGDSGDAGAPGKRAADEDSGRQTSAKTMGGRERSAGV